MFKDKDGVWRDGAPVYEDLESESRESYVFRLECEQRLKAQSHKVWVRILKSYKKRNSNKK